jgi:hypothetical protein
MSIEARLYHYGLGVGMPYRALNRFANACSEAGNARDLARRRRLAREMLSGSTWRGFIPKDKGYAPVAPDTLPGANEAIECVREIVRDRQSAGFKARPHNPFYQLEKPEHFRDYPALTNFILSDTILHIVSDYYGMVPQLKAAGIWLTTSQEKQFGSQLFHLDKPEAQIVGLFINAEANDTSTGPLTLLPSDVSWVVRGKTNYESVYFRGNGRLTDETVFQNCRTDDQVSLGSGPGVGVFADTSNCFHFGSRCQEGERTMLMLKFMLPHKVQDTRTPIFDLVPEPADDVRRMVLSGAKFAGG